MTINTGRLYREILAAGIAPSALAGTREKPREVEDAGKLPERWAIDWLTPPTPAQLATARAVIVAHDPDIEVKEKAQALTAARALRAALLADWQAAAPGPLRRALGVLLALHDDVRPEAKP